MEMEREMGASTGRLLGAALAAASELTVEESRVSTSMLPLAASRVEEEDTPAAAVTAEDDVAGVTLTSATAGSTARGNAANSPKCVTT